MGRRAIRAALATAVVVLATVVVAPSPASAHTPHDVIYDIEHSPEFATDDTLFTISREYLMRSTDAGRSWARMSNGLDHHGGISAVEVSATDPQVLYVSSRGDGVFRSRDGGASWERASQGLDGHRNLVKLAVSPHDDDVVAAIDIDGALLWTTDGGDRWEVVSATDSGPASSVVFAAADPNLVLVGTASGGLLRSTDRGASWSDIDTGIDDPITAVAVVGSDGPILAGTESDGIYRSTDGGGSFDDAGSGLDDDRILALAVSPGTGDDQRVWASTWTAGVHRSDDGGETWSPTGEGTSTNEMADDLGHPHFTELSVSEADGGGTSLFVSGFDGLFWSDDGGDSWDESETQAASNIVTVALSPDYARDRSLGVVTYVNGMSFSDDDGATWVHQNAGFTHRYEFERRPDYFARLTGLWFSPTYADDAEMFLGSRGYWGTSTDISEPWDLVVLPELVTGGNTADFLLLAPSPDFANDRTLIAGTDTGRVLRSTDGGETFEKIASVDDEIVALVASPGFADDGLLLASTPERVFQVSDGGETWEPVEGSPRSILSLTISSGFAEDGIAFAGTKNGLFRSQDGGTTWTKVTGTPLGPNPYVEAAVTSPDFADDGTVLVSARGLGLFRSTDGGATFEPVGDDLRARNVLLASFYHPTAEPIVFSPDFATDRTVFGQAESTVYRSTDAGETWEPIEIPVAEHGMDPEDAPNELITIPGPDDLDGHDHGAGPVRAVAAASRSDDGLVFTTKRVALAVGAALIALAVLFVLPLKRWIHHAGLLLAVRLGGALVVLLAALYVLGSRD